MIFLRVFDIIMFKLLQKLIRKLITEILYFESTFNCISSSNIEIFFNFNSIFSVELLKLISLFN